MLSNGYFMGIREGKDDCIGSQGGRRPRKGGMDDAEYVR